MCVCVCVCVCMCVCVCVCMFLCVYLCGGWGDVVGLLQRSYICRGADQEIRSLPRDARRRLITRVASFAGVIVPLRSSSDSPVLSPLPPLPVALFSSPTPTPALPLVQPPPIATVMASTSPPHQSVELLLEDVNVNSLLDQVEVCIFCCFHFGDVM